MLITACAYAYFYHRKSRKRAKKDLENSSTGCRRFTYETISHGTDKFSDKYKLGQGGFGSVYKCFLGDGQPLVAVKRPLTNSKQGAAQFENEVKLLTKLKHKNLVTLLGFCFERNEKLLIYEFLPNLSLNHFIFDKKKSEQLDWTKRHRIMVGIAKGLVYMHEESPHRIIHCDLKLSNILLDEDMNPKISDFGISKLFADDQSHASTSRINGTIGYIAPEHMNHNIFSAKSDVFSFGVIVLEIISGQRTNNFPNSKEERNFLTYVWDNWKENTYSNIIDPVLMLEASSRTEILRCIHIAFLCVQKDSEQRPTMDSVIKMLDNSSFDLANPSKPAYYKLHSLEQNPSSSPTEPSNSNQNTVNERTRTEMVPR